MFTVQILYNVCQNILNINLSREAYSADYSNSNNKEKAGIKYTHAFTYLE